MRLDCTDTLGPGRAPVRRSTFGALLLAACLGTAAVPSLAQDARPASNASWIDGWDFGVKLGTAKKSDVKKYGVVAGYNVQAPLWQGEQWSFRLRHEIELAGWDVPYASRIVEGGYTPMWRLQRPVGGGGAVVFVEAGIGARLLSHVHTEPGRSLSTAFQFSDEIGAGVQFGREGRAMLGIRYQHISNADIKMPNPGMDFYAAYFNYKF